MIKESCNLIEWEHLTWPKTCEAEFCQIWDLHRQTAKCKFFHFRLFPVKNKKIIKKNSKASFWAFFAHLRETFFLKNPFLWLSFVSRFLSLCKSPEKKDARMDWSMSIWSFPYKYSYSKDDVQFLQCTVQFWLNLTIPQFSFKNFEIKMIPVKSLPRK